MKESAVTIFTFAPGRENLASESNTRPDMDEVWAEAKNAEKTARSRKVSLGVS